MRFSSSTINIRMAFADSVTPLPQQPEPQLFDVSGSQGISLGIVAVYGSEEFGNWFGRRSRVHVGGFSRGNQLDGASELEDDGGAADARSDL